MEQLMSLDISPALIIADPPYDIPQINGGGTVNSIKGLRDSLQDLCKPDADMTKGYDIQAFACIVDKLQRGNVNAYFFANKRQLPEYMQAYVAERKCKFEILCWHKSNAMPTYNNKYLSDTEYIVFVHKGKGQTHPKSYQDAKTWWCQPINADDKKVHQHPTIKPLNIVQTLVGNSSRAGDLVLDPFCGSGTTGVACANLGRSFIGIERNAQYADIARRRISQAWSSKDRPSPHT